MRNNRPHLSSQWRIQKFVLGGGAKRGSGAVHPAGVQGADSLLGVWGQIFPEAAAVLMHSA